MKVLSVTNAVRYGLNGTWAHIGFLIKVFLVCFLMAFGFWLLLVLANLPLVMILLEEASQGYTTTVVQGMPHVILDWCVWMWLNSSWWFYTLIFLLSALAMSFFTGYLFFGVANIVLELYDYGRSSLKTLFQPIPIALQAFGASVLFGLGLMVGFTLLFVPGIIWFLVFGFFLFAIADVRCGIIDSFKISYATTSGARLRLLCIGLLLLVINIGINVLFVVLDVLAKGSPFTMLVVIFLAMFGRLFMYFACIMSCVYAYRILQTQTNLPAVVE